MFLGALRDGWNAERPGGVQEGITFPLPSAGLVLVAAIIDADPLDPRVKHVERYRPTHGDEGENVGVGGVKDEQLVLRHRKWAGRARLEPQVNPFTGDQVEGAKTMRDLQPALDRFIFGVQHPDPPPTMGGECGCRAAHGLLALRSIPRLMTG